MASYRTEQQTCLLKFLKAHCREPMTVREMYRRMKQEYASMTIPGESTIYRLIRKLTNDGLVRKSMHTEQREIFYSYANPTDQNAVYHFPIFAVDRRACESHFLLKNLHPALSVPAARP